MKKITLPYNVFTPAMLKKVAKMVCICTGTFFSHAAIAQDTPTTVTVFDEILFYDGYAQTVTEPVPDGVIRHNNSAYAKKLTQEQIDALGNTLIMNITIKAACDNYDRIGSANIALVPKNATSYNYNDVTRIEIGRYITPFMDKNVMPDEVPYTYDVDNVTRIVKDPVLSAQYDFWVELEVFGVPYAANEQIAGCEGRSDVFFGSLEFVSDNSGTTVDGDNFMLPLSYKFEMRDYTLEGTDVLNETVKTINFTLDEPVQDAKYYLITSNHGAGSGGEEYVRRWHYIYHDGEEVSSYRPGGVSCVPFLQYNTQGNCIYYNCNTGVPLADTNAAWSWNNWCPGDKIPIRVIELGNLAAGDHSFKIDVPAAVFAGNDGHFPMSVYLQGKTGTLATQEFSTTAISVFPNPVNNLLTIEAANTDVKNVTITNLAGQTVLTTTTKTVDVSQLASGAYFVNIALSNGQALVKKVIKQ
ncbi:T9SS type A sorting domain-containing protein [Flavobacterium zepuense]|uniref:T9SS type A sorting domain-containing protein n=1 Tax=Flavobacterium zepuense TaxID=2593302 RepID=A0A552V870_9FLAO|nr:peptide-N-glycosidase F-related protein [Flavobacterium zepuense]TRW26662.1 T9SS type A sorting domain-containing protein [Flavobacterium zepuense]